jgi:hypothetical protein
MHQRKTKAAKSKDRSGAPRGRAALRANGAATKRSAPAQPSDGGGRRGPEGPVGDYYRLMLDWSPLGLMLRQQALFARAWSEALRSGDANASRPRRSRRG